MDEHHEMTEISFNDIEYSEDLVVLYDGEPLTGRVVDRDDDGRIVRELEFLEGFQEGPERIYHPNGQLQSERMIDTGLASGPARTWYENGQLESESVYRNGRIISQKKWSENGQPLPQ
jgi:antitoxin component YwqK of YwqJK toxin-antitoxin module